MRRPNKSNNKSHEFFTRADMSFSNNLLFFDESYTAEWIVAAEQLLDA